MLTDKILTIVSSIQLLMPDLIWVKDNSQYIHFITTKKRLNFYELTQVCNFVNGKNLTKSVHADKTKYRFEIDALRVCIHANTKCKNIKVLSLHNDIIIKFTE